MPAVLSGTVISGAVTSVINISSNTPDPLYDPLFPNRLQASMESDHGCLLLKPHDYNRGPNVQECWWRGPVSSRVASSLAHSPVCNLSDECWAWASLRGGGVFQSNRAGITEPITGLVPKSSVDLCVYRLFIWRCVFYLHKRYSCFYDGALTRLLSRLYL